MFISKKRIIASAQQSQIIKRIFSLLSPKPDVRAIQRIIENCQDKEYLKAQLNTPNDEVRSRNKFNTQSIVNTN